MGERALALACYTKAASKIYSGSQSLLILVVFYVAVVDNTMADMKI